MPRKKAEPIPTSVEPSEIASEEQTLFNPPETEETNVPTPVIVAQDKNALFTAEETDFPHSASEDASVAVSGMDRSAATVSADASPSKAADMDAEIDEFLAGICETRLEGVPVSDTDPLLLVDEDAESTADADVVSASRSLTVPKDTRILTVNHHVNLMSDEERSATLWHDIVNAFYRKRILTGTLDDVAKTESGITVAVTYYNGFRILIPLKEMLLAEPDSPSLKGLSYNERVKILIQRLHARLNCEIDFIIRGIDNKSQSIVASRKEAMYRKRQTFYMTPDEYGEPLIYEGRIVQARVVAVGERYIRVEVFGVECKLHASSISSGWFASAAEEYQVGDLVLVRVNSIRCPDVEHLSILADMRGLNKDRCADVSNCMVSGNYVGRIVGIRNGVFMLRLNNGVNAIAHSTYDLRTPGKKDDVSFVVTRLDEKDNVAIGIITRIIRQNL